MSIELVKYVYEYVSSVIIGFESSFYKMLWQNNHDKIKLITSKHHPFITIFRDMHEKYYTKTFNAIINRNDKYVVTTFDNFNKLCKHSISCMLTILANLSISVHFNLDREKLDASNHNSYCKSLSREISNTISTINIAKLFEHNCLQTNDVLKPLADGEKFITISLSTMSNGVKKSVNSFSDDKIDE